MNAVATTEPKPALNTSAGPVLAIRPTDADQMYRLADAVTKTSMVPKGYQGKPMEAMVAMMYGAELGLSAIQSLQSVAVINGTPALWGDGLLAVCRTNGAKVSESISGEGDVMVATCTVTRPDTGEVVTRTYSVADAKKAGLWNKQGPWQQHPKRMLSMRARGFALRDAMADVLRGFVIREVLEDDFPAADATIPEKPAVVLPRSLAEDYAPPALEHGATEEVLDDAIPEAEPATIDAYDEDGLFQPMKGGEA